VISVYAAYSCLPDVWSLSHFGTQGITTLKVVFCNSWRLPLALWHGRSRKSVTGCMVPCFPFVIASWTMHAHVFPNISIHCHWNHTPLSKFSNRSPFSQVTIQSPTGVPQYWGSFQSCLKWVCLWIMHWCFFSRNPATNTFFHLLNVPKYGCPILLPNCFKENSVCFRLIGALPSARPVTNTSSLALFARYSPYESSGNGGQSVIPATSIPKNSATSWNHFAE